MAPIARSFAIDDLIVEADEARLDGTIVVQTVADSAETEEVLDRAMTTPLVRGVIGWVDVSSAAVGDDLDRLAALPGSDALIGIRSLAQFEPDPGWLARRDVIAGLRAVAQRGLTFDLLVLPHQIAAACVAARAVPEARFVLDHLGKPAIARQMHEPWDSAIADLASCANVYAKISGLFTEADWSRWQRHDFQPYVDTALQLFGADRLMFGSDWPVCTLAASYAQVVDTTEQLLSTLTTAERAAVFGRTARRAYSLADRQEENQHGCQ